MKNLILGSLVFFFTILLLWYLIYFQLSYIETKFVTNFETNFEGLENISIGLTITNITIEKVKDTQRVLKASSDTDVIVSQLQSLELGGKMDTILNDEQNDSYKILQDFLVEFNSQVDLLYGKNMLIYYPFDKVLNIRTSNDKVLNESSSNKGNNDGIVLPRSATVKINFNDPPGIKKAYIDLLANQITIQIPSITFDEDGKFGGFTAAFWFKPTNVTGDNGGCIFEFSNGVTKDNITLLSVDNMIALRVINQNQNQTGINANIDKTLLKEWGHYVCTVSKSGSMVIYRNGNMITKSDPKDDIVPTAGARSSNLIGRSETWGYNPLKGKLADFRVYNTEWKEDYVKNYYDYINFKLKVNMSNFIINFHLDGKNTESITNDNNGLLVWKDTVWNGTTNGIASDTRVVYHTTSQKVTIPSGSCIDIPNNNNNFGAPFTVYIVANMYDFNPTQGKGTGNIPHNSLFSSSEKNAFEVYFYQNMFRLNLVWIGGGTPTKFPSMPEIDPTIPHIFTITCDSTGKLSFYIDSRPIAKKQKLANNQIPGNYPIRLACALGTNEYPSSNDLDYYEILHLHNYHSGYSRNMFEGLLAEKWSLRSQLDDSNIFKNLPLR